MLNTQIIGGHPVSRIFAQRLDGLIDRAAMYPDHLTNIPLNVDMLASHPIEDICAYRKDGRELFALNGRALALDSHHWPSAFQLVIDLCAMDRDEFTDYVTWLNSELFY